MKTMTKDALIEALKNSKVKGNAPIVVNDFTGEKVVTDLKEVGGKIELTATW